MNAREGGKFSSFARFTAAGGVAAVLVLAGASVGISGTFSMGWGTTGS